MFYISMLLFNFYLFVVFVESRSNNFDSALGEVVFVNVIYRHGARTPDKSYKNDLFKDYFREGLGELTNEGKKQQFELGRWLRQRYDCLLTDTYSPELINVKSSDKDRVLMSAQCNLAGMFPPKGDQLWMDDLNWQPIPIHTVPQEADKIIAMKAPCPAYDKELDNVLQSREVKKLLNKYQWVIDILNGNTGDIRNDYKYIANIYDTLYVQSQYNLELPSWSKDIFPQPMEEATLLRFNLPTWNKKLCRLRAGPLLQELIKNMETKVKTNSKKVMQVYSAHDTTVVNLLNTLGVWDKKLTPYSACVMMELRRSSSGDYYVTVMYQPSVTDLPQVLTIPGCSAACPLDKFITLIKPFVPLDWNKECQEI